MNHELSVIMPNSKKIAIIYSLRKEVESLLKDLEIIDSQTIGKGEYARCHYQGHEVMMVLAGVGGKSVQKTLDGLFEIMKPDLLILTGFAGAADPVYKSGAVVVPDKIVTIGGKTIVVDVPSEILSCLGGLADIGTLITVNRIYGHADKAMLRQKYGERISVDMESGFVAEWALQHQIKFMVIKAISDPYNFKLPSYQFILKLFGKQQVKSSIKEALLHPVESYRLARLAGNCQKAEENLNKALETFFKVL
jgi:adenosylhomocysteine nucleosidase